MRWVVAVLLAGLIAVPEAAARHLSGMVPDVPTGHVALASAQAQVARLQYGNGPVLHSNRTYVIFWRPSGSSLSFDRGYRPLIERFLRDVAAASHRTSNVFSLTGQYTDYTGKPAAYSSHYGRAVLDTDRLPASDCVEPPGVGPAWIHCLTDRKLQREIEHVIQVRRLPLNEQDVYLLVTPRGLGDCMDSSSTSCALGGSVNGYCGYHQVTNDGLVHYAVIPYNAVKGHCQSGNPRPNRSTADPALSTISHELSEMITDPNQDAWSDPSGKEDGDLCISNFGRSVGGSGATAYNEVINRGHYYLQVEWSNSSGSCQQRAKPDHASFSATHRVGHPRVLFFRGRGRSPQAKIVAYHWRFGDHRSAWGRTVSHRFRRSASYTVALRVVDRWHNWGFYTRTVRVAATGT